MRVFQNTFVSVEKLLSTLLSDQAKFCKGRNASQREAVRNVQGRQMIRAQGACENGNGSVLNITYKVAELGQRPVMMVMEVKSAGGASTSGKASGGPIRVPGPQEL